MSLPPVKRKIRPSKSQSKKKKKLHRFVFFFNIENDSIFKNPVLGENLKNDPRSETTPFLPINVIGTI